MKAPRSPRAPRRSGPCRPVLLMLCLAGCATGPQALPPSPPNVAIASQLSPHTKGGTVLGVVAWPAEVPLPAERRFEIRLLSGGREYQTLSDGQSRFRIDQTLLGPDLRLEARSFHDPELVLRLDAPVPEALPASGLELTISLESTALVALREHLARRDSPLQALDPARLQQPVLRAEWMPVKDAMMPFLSKDMDSSLESMPTVQTALETARQHLEAMLM